MNIFGIGLPEMVVIFVLALLIFGPKKLPEIGRSLGKTLRSFQEASKEFESEIKKGVAEMEKEESQNPPPAKPAALEASSTSEFQADSSNGVVPEEASASPTSESSKPQE